MAQHDSEQCIGKRLENLCTRRKHLERPLRAFLSTLGLALPLLTVMGCFDGPETIAREQRLEKKRSLLREEHARVEQELADIDRQLKDARDPALKDALQEQRELAHSRALRVKSGLDALGGGSTPAGGGHH